MQEPVITRWTLIRDMAFFQAKLAMDAIRDLFLSPVSMVFGMVDILRGSPLSKSYFHKLMNFGHKTDAWINLFGKKHDMPEKAPSSVNEEVAPDASIDQLFSRIEFLLKEQHDKGGLTATAKGKIDSYLNKIVERKNS